MAAPGVITEGVTNVAPTKATFVGQCRSLGDLPTIAWFEIKSGPPWYTKITDSIEVTETWKPFGLEWPVSGSIFITHFRAIAANVDGTDYGDWLKFWVPEAGTEAEGSPFYISQHEGTWVERQLTLYLWSDVPCHLWAHVGTKPPWKKRGFHFKRGRIFHHSPRVFFGYKWSLEQGESGDVDLHSFVIDFPPEHNTLWIQAMGNIDGKKSPSRSPFFRYSVFREVYSLGIYSQAPPLEDHVSLEPGAGIVLTYDQARNTIIVSDPVAPPGRIRRHGYGHGRGPRNT